MRGRHYETSHLAATLISAPRGSPLLAGGRNSVAGSYVEARTAEVFTGGCVMGSEAETMGKQAVLAWKVDRGSFNGIARRLSVVAALSGDRNLGIPRSAARSRQSEAAMFVDERANAAQQLALVAMANELSKAAHRHHRQRDAGADSVRRHGGEIDVVGRPGRARRQQAPDARSDLRREAVVPPARVGRRRRRWASPTSTRSPAPGSARSGATRTSPPRSSAHSVTNEERGRCRTDRKGRLRTSCPSRPSSPLPAMNLTNTVALITGGKRIGSS